MTSGGLDVTTRTAPAGADYAMRTVSRWVADAEDPGLLMLSLTTEPGGTWRCPLPHPPGPSAGHRNC